MIKSIFARPVFINPQAYLVIPQLANLSMLEPIDFTSTNTYSFESLSKVESKIISTKDEYILHMDLYELDGSCVLGEFYIGPATIGSIDDFTITTNGYITTIEVSGGDSGNIIYPGLIAAWSAKGKTNADEDRAILKDLTGNGYDITLNGFAFNTEESGYNNPQYPDALVFDGVDDYGINENMPILTDYTIIAKRKFINGGKGALLTKADDVTKGAFVFEGGDSFITKLWSFGRRNDIDVISDDISWMTTLSYNEKPLKKGSVADVNTISLGGSRYWQGAFCSIYLFDRSLDKQEIKEFIRKYIDPDYVLPSEQQP